MIPKVLHYVWLGGGEKSSLMQNCMESWKKFCPGWEIKEWNEKNFDLNSSPLIKKAIERRNWALAADAMKVLILREHGGVYVDTDIEIIKPLDGFLKHPFFIGYESSYWLNGAIIGSVPDHPVLRPLCALYKTELGLTMSNLLTVHIFSAVFKKMYGLRANGKTVITDEYAVYSKEWFYPIDYLSHKVKKTANTHTVHYYSGTWGTKKQAMALRTFRRVLKWLLFPAVTRPWELAAARSYRRRANKRLLKI